MLYVSIIYLWVGYGKATGIVGLQKKYRYYNRLRKLLGQISAVLIVMLAKPSVVTFAAGFPVVVLGEAVRIWALGYIKKDIELATKGPYRYVRHPLYLGSSLIASGFLIIAGNIYLALTLPLVFYIVYKEMIKMEEDMLWVKFGAAFQAYCESTGKVIPMPGGRGSGAAGGGSGFCVRNVLHEREYRAVFGIVFIIMTLFVKEMYFK